MTAHDSRYRNRFARVLDYLEAHLEQTLDIATLARVAAFSPFHFQRQFSALFGIGVYRCVQLLRLQRAGQRLAFREALPITDIALASGYASTEAFARAFRKLAGQGPSEFRAQPQWSRWHAALQPLESIRRMPVSDDFDAGAVQLALVDDIPVAVLEHRGDPRLIGDSLRRFIAWRKQAGLPPRLSATYNIVHDDSEEIAPRDCRFGLGAGIGGALGRRFDADVAVVHGIVRTTIPGGRVAVLRHTGSDDTLAAAIRGLYAHWLPGSGEVPRDFPLYLQRLRLFPDVPAHEAVTDIFLPLR